MNNLTLIVHGRSASTLVLNQLLATGKFKIWRGKTTRESPFASKPRLWNRTDICKEWDKIKDEGEHILSKLPAFAFFIDEMLILEPDIIVLERPIVDIVRSYFAVKWVESVLLMHETMGTVEKASKKYIEFGGRRGVVTDATTIGLIFAYSHWKVREELKSYPNKIYVDYHDIVTGVAYNRIEEFIGVEPNTYADKWRAMSKNRHQATARTRPIVDYLKTLDVGLTTKEINEINNMDHLFYSKRARV